jgi:hypothetical protein
LRLPHHFSFCHCEPFFGEAIPLTVRGGPVMNQKSSDLRRELTIGLIGGVWVLVYFISSLLLDKYKFAP